MIVKMHFLSIENKQIITKSSIENRHIITKSSIENTQIISKSSTIENRQIITKSSICLNMNIVFYLIFLFLYLKFNKFSLNRTEFL